MGENDPNKKLTTDNIIKTLIIGMILFMTGMVVISIITSKYDIVGMSVSIVFIFALLILKWLIKEAGME